MYRRWLTVWERKWKGKSNQKLRENDEEKDLARRVEIAKKTTFHNCFTNNLGYRNIYLQLSPRFQIKIVMRYIHLIEKVKCGCQSTNNSKSDTCIYIPSKHDKLTINYISILFFLNFKICSLLANIK